MLVVRAEEEGGERAVEVQLAAAVDPVVEHENESKNRQSQENEEKVQEAESKSEVRVMKTKLVPMSQFVRETFTARHFLLRFFNVCAVCQETMETEGVVEWISVGFFHAFVAAFSVIIVSEIGDKTFFIAAIMAMKHSR